MVQSIMCGAPDSTSYCERTFIRWKPIYVVSTKCIDPWFFEFVVSNITDNNQWENYISLDFYFRGP